MVRSGVAQQGMMRSVGAWFRWEGLAVAGAIDDGAEGFKALSAILMDGCGQTWFG